MRGLAEPLHQPRRKYLDVLDPAGVDQEDVGRFVLLPTQHPTSDTTSNLTDGGQGSPILGTERLPERRHRRIRQGVAPLELLAHRRPFSDQAVPIAIVDTRRD